MVFLPILSRFGRLEQRKLYATCVGVIFPVCLVSAAVYIFRGGVSLLTALPYLAGGLIGGFQAVNYMAKSPPSFSSGYLPLFSFTRG